ncbi:MAG: glycosyltransferase family 2 protein [Caldilinea sp.]|nr:glycosyltransferase family 2 protein [Caldilinea sp.]MDW8441860.1 glycosyltransferase family 2 protein [Caldilineaceae bacterium]
MSEPSDLSTNSTQSTPQKPEKRRTSQIAQARKKFAETDSAEAHRNPIVLDETYSELRERSRVVMRHNIALNLDAFRAASEEFTLRPARSYPPLRETTTPFASVIVPNYNGARHLPIVLDALCRQTFHDFEVIVVDDASRDESVALVETHYPNVRLIVNRRNVGFVRSCNTGAAAARGRMLVLLNNDTEPEPTWLEELVKTFVAYPRAAMVASKLLLFDRRDTLHTTGDMLGVDGIPRNRGVWERDEGQYDAAPTIFSGCGGATAYRREVWEALGGFDEDFWMYLEDVDFGFRARLAGWEAVFAPRARVYHRLSASGGDALASYYVGRNTIWLIAKNMPRSLLRRNALAIVRGQLAITWEALRQWRGEAARARLRGQFAGVLGLVRQLQKRRAIQPRRQIEDEDLARMLVMK